MTTFSKQGYVDYGKRCLETFSRFVDCDLIVVLDEPVSIEVNNQISIMDNKFKNQIEKTYSGFERSVDFRFSPNIFCFKTSAIATVADQLHESVEFLVWIDGDTFFKKSGLEQFLQTIFPVDFQIASFFDRNKSYGYSETGLIIFNLKHGNCLDFIERWNTPFVDGTICSFFEWHDAFLFSHLMRQYPPDTFRLLCEDFNLLSTHPIDEFVSLRGYMEHLKGPARKRLGFNHSKFGAFSKLVKKII